MDEFLTNPIFKYGILPIGSAMLGVAVSVDNTLISRNSPSNHTGIRPVWPKGILWRRPSSDRSALSLAVWIRRRLGPTNGYWYL